MAAGSRSLSTRASLVVVPEPVPDPVHREEMARLAGIRLELSADVLHVRVDRAFVRLECDAVHRVEELRPREHAARLAGERRDELELGGGELDVAVPDPHAHARYIERNVASADDVTALRGTLRPPEHRPHPGDELLRRERLRDVVVRAELQADELVALLVAPAEDEDRDRRVATEGPRDVEAIELRQAEVQHDEIGMLRACARERLRPIGGARDRESRVLEVVPGELDDLRLVVDDEDRLHARMLRTGWRRAIRGSGAGLAVRALMPLLESRGHVVPELAVVAVMTP